MVVSLHSKVSRSLRTRGHRSRPFGRELPQQRTRTRRLSVHGSGQSGYGGGQRTTASEPSRLVAAVCRPFPLLRAANRPSPPVIPAGDGQIVRREHKSGYSWSCTKNHPEGLLRPKVASKFVGYLWSATRMPSRASSRSVQAWAAESWRRNESRNRSCQLLLPSAEPGFLDADNGGGFEQSPTAVLHPPSLYLVGLTAGGHRD